MSHVTVRQEIDAPASAVWDLVGNFEGTLEPRVAVQRTTIEDDEGGRVRTMELVGGDVLRERLEFIDPARRSYRSVFFQMPQIPVKNCTNAVHVDELPSGHCLLEFDFDFEPQGASEEKACAMIEGVCTGFVNSIREIVETR